VLDSLIDPVFQLPFVVGLLVSSVLPLIGCMLHLRGEWLAALGFAHLAGASALVGLLTIGMPAVFGALLGAIAGALLKAFGRFRGNAIFALMILSGWSATLLVAANSPIGMAMGHTMIEGQLYFADKPQLVAAAVLVGLTILMLLQYAHRLVRAVLFPMEERANRLPAWRWHLGFDLLSALAVAVGIGTVGLMATFALVFVPAWLSFRLAPGWRTALFGAVCVSICAYLITFILALRLDQPFGPLLVAVLLGGAVMAGVFKLASSGFRPDFKYE